MVKTTGYEIKKFFDDKVFWPEDIYYYEVEWIINGTSSGDFDPVDLKDDDQVKFKGGIIYNEGKYCEDFEKFFKLWRKKQTKSSFVVECDVYMKDQVIDAIRAAGGNVI